MTEVLRNVRGIVYLQFTDGNGNQCKIKPGELKEKVIHLEIGDVQMCLESEHIGLLQASLANFRRTGEVW